MSTTVLGLDIGSSHIKAVSIERGRKNRLLRYAMAPTKDISAKILSSSDADNQAAAGMLKGFLKDFSFTDTQVVAILPEYRVFSKVITMPALHGGEFKQAVEWEAEQHLPQPLAEVYLKYTVLEEHIEEKPKTKSKDIDIMAAIKGTGKSEEKGAMEVLLVAVSRDMVDSYLKVLNLANLAVLGIEPTSMAMIRSVVQNDASIPTIIVNFGDSNVDFYLAVDNTLRFVRPINFGISSIVRAIAQELDISPLQANEYLFAYGLKEKELDGKIKEIIDPVLSIIVDELKKAQQYIESRDSMFGGSKDQRIRRYILSGGGALIPDMMLYLVQMVSAEVQIANPWKSVDISDIKRQRELEMYGPLFSGAVGAALKEFN